MTDRFINTAQFYVKIDLAILAALGTVFTILKLDVVGIPKAFLTIQGYVLFLIILLFCGLALERVVVLFVEEIQRHSGLANFLKSLFILQTVAHILFFIGLHAIATGYSSGYVEAANEMKRQEATYQFVKTQVDKFIRKHRQVPANFDDVLRESPELFRSSDSIYMDRFVYTRLDSASYQVAIHWGDSARLHLPDRKWEVVIVEKRE